jgi:hypothetical protein
MSYLAVYGLALASNGSLVTLNGRLSFPTIIHTILRGISSDRAYRPRRWRERAAPVLLCLRSREGYIRHIVSSHSLFISSSFCLEMSMKIENPASCEIGQWSNFWMPKMFARLKFIDKFVKFMEKMLWVMEWWEGGVGCTVKGGRISRLWSKWPPVVCHCRSAWPGEWEDSRKQKIYIFLHLKRFLAAERFSRDDEVKTAMQHWVRTLAADFFDEGIQKLLPDVTDVSIWVAIMSRSS